MAMEADAPRPHRTPAAAALACPLLTHEGLLAEVTARQAAKEAYKVRGAARLDRLKHAALRASRIAEAEAKAAEATAAAESAAEAAAEAAEEAAAAEAQELTHTCETCGSPHDGSYGSGRFCGSGCRNTKVKEPVDPAEAAAMTAAVAVRRPSHLLARSCCKIRGAIDWNGAAVAHMREPARPLPPRPRRGRSSRSC